MPIAEGDFRPLAWQRGGHLQTIVPNLFRRLMFEPGERRRIDTPDNDFLDLDFYDGQSDRLAVITHGLEADSRRPYMLGMVKAFAEAGYDVIAWNFRSCGGELNRQLRFYHSGATDDLMTIIRYGLSLKQYKAVVPVGFSLGGNMTLKLMGEDTAALPDEVRSAVAISVPVHLSSCSDKLDSRAGYIYRIRFVKTLVPKAIKKHEYYPDRYDITGLKKIRSLRVYDDRITSVLHGFEGAEHYYNTCSAINFVGKVDRPVLLVNAQNDPFLTSKCYPREIAAGHEYFYFMSPEQGGHVGFCDTMKQDAAFWSERTALEFAQRHG